jgi:hypothetical protein
MYGGKLTINGGSTLYQYNDTSGLFESVDVAAQGFNFIEVFKGELYLTGSFVIQKWDGAYTEVFNGTGLYGGLFSPEVHNNGLYVGAIQAAFGANGLLSCDGIDFPTFFMPNGNRTRRLMEYNGILYIGGLDTTNDELFFYTLSGATQCSDKTIEYIFGVNSNYSGTPFFSQPRKSPTDFKRHRYFFSYNRDDFSNNIDDEALIGIGFVPRYLEPPMKEN